MNKMAFKLSLSKMIVSKWALLNWRQASLMTKSSATNALVHKYSLAWARRTEPLLFLTRKAELEELVVNLQSELHFNQSIWGFLQLWEVLEVDLSFFASWAFQWLRADLAIHFAAIWMGGMVSPWAIWFLYFQIISNKTTINTMDSSLSKLAGSKPLLQSTMRVNQLFKVKLLKERVGKFHLEIDQSWVIRGQVRNIWPMDSLSWSQRGQVVEDMGKKEFILVLVGMRSLIVPRGEAYAYYGSWLSRYCSKGSWRAKKH